MLLTYRRKLRPTGAQNWFLEEQLERQRLLYNAAPQERRDAWRLARKLIARLDQQGSLTVVRADDPLDHGALDVCAPMLRDEPCPMSFPMGSGRSAVPSGQGRKGRRPDRSTFAAAGTSPTPPPAP